MELTLSERFMYNAVYIAMLDQNDTLIGSATGFLYGFCANERGSVLCLVTNRHVLSNCQIVHLTFTLEKENNMPDIGNHAQVEMSTANAIYHPNDKIDLAILPIGSALSAVRSTGANLFYAMFSAENIPSSEEWNQFSAIENVYMAGFPKGFRDEVNNQPILRSGITATHPALNFQGRPEFLVDMPCFQGCSGSPVFIYDEGFVVNKRNRQISTGSRVRLLGVQYAIPNRYVIGQLATVPTSDTQDVPVIPLYMNLGFIIKSSELLIFEDIISAQLNSITAGST